VETVTDRRRNPFGVAYPCEDGSPVASYGDASADVHLVGDYPGVHGGRESGVPFDAPVVAPLLDVLRTVGLVAGSTTAADADDEVTADAVAHAPRDLFCSYRHACPTGRKRRRRTPGSSRRSTPSCGQSPPACSGRAATARERVRDTREQAPPAPGRRRRAACP